MRNWVLGKNCRVLGYMTFFKTTHFPKIRRRKKSDGNKSVVKEYDEDNCDDDDDNNNDDDHYDNSDLQWTEIGPSWPNCSLVLCT